MSPDGLHAVPDLIEPIVAYRAWRYRLDRRGAHLGSFGGIEDVWAGACRTWVVASCLMRAGHPFASGADHLAPDERCSCGFYGTKTPDIPAQFMAIEWLDRAMRSRGSSPVEPTFDDGLVLGRVELAGKVIEHEHGYRAQRARVLELIPLESRDEATGSLSRLLEVPVADPYDGPALDIRSEDGPYPYVHQDGETERARSLTLLERLRLMRHQRAFHLLQGGLPDEDDLS
jgi:hypothetical protein